MCGTGDFLFIADEVSRSDVTRGTSPAERLSTGPILNPVFHTVGDEGGKNLLPFRVLTGAGFLGAFLWPPAGCISAFTDNTNPGTPIPFRV